MIIVKPEKGQEALFTKIEFEQLHHHSVPLSTPSTSTFDSHYAFPLDYPYEHYDMSQNQQNPASSLNSLGSNRSSSTLPSLSRTPSSVSMRQSRLGTDSAGPSSLTGSSISAARQAGPQALYTDYKIGDYVYVDSLSGIKFGVIRYTGYVEFAPGFWFGIELSEPLGKNNGTIKGKQYFKCEDLHGIFTQASKISKSPPIRKNKRAGLGIGYSGSTFGSKESLNSTLSCSRRNGLTASQESLQSCVSGVSAITGVFKHGAIRPGDRAAKSGALEEANQARMRSEKLLFEKQQECGQIKNELDQGRQTLEQLQTQLDEERKKIEALEFRLEEETVTRMHLDEELHKERQKLELLEQQQQQQQQQQQKQQEQEQQSPILSTNVGGHHHEKSSKDEENEMEMFQLQEELIKKEESLLQLENSLKSKCLENSNLLERLREYEQTLKVFEQRQTNHLATIDELNLKLKKYEQLQQQFQEDVNVQRKELESVSKAGSDANQAVINSLNDQLSRKKEEVMFLKQELQQAQDGALEAGKEKESLAQQLQRMQARLEDSGKNSQEISHLQNELKCKEVKLSLLQQQLEQREMVIKQKDECLNDHQTKLCEQQKMLEEQHNRLIEYQTQTTDQQSRLNRMDEQRKHLETEIEKWIQKSEMDSQVLTNLKQSITEKETTIERLRQDEKIKLQQLQSQQSLSQDQQTQLQQALTDAQAQIKAVQLEQQQRNTIELNAKDEQLRSLEAELRTHFESNAQLSQEIAEFQRKYKRRGEEMDKCMGELELVHQNAVKHEQERQNLENEVDTLKSQLEHKDEQLRTFDRKKLQFQNEMEELMRELNQLKDENRRLDDQGLKMGENRRNLEENHQKLIDNIQRLEQINRKSEENCQNLQENHAKLQESHATLDESHRQLQNVYTKLEGNHQSLKEDYEKLQQSLAEMETIRSQTVDDLKCQLDSSQKRCDHLQQEWQHCQQQLEQTRTLHENEIKDIRTRHVEMMNEFETDVIKLEEKINQMSESLRCKDELITELELRNDRSADMLRQHFDQERHELLNKIELLQQSLEKNQSMVDEALSKQFDRSLNVPLGDLHSGSEAGSVGGQYCSAEDRELYESQIKFLNTVIVDMQMKNDELKNRIQILEEIRMSEMKQFTSAATSSADNVDDRFRFRPVRRPSDNETDVAYVNVYTKTARLYCDLCDVFDAHDSEDCPKSGRLSAQDLLSGVGSASNSKPSTPVKNVSKKVNRAYCANCEMFEHWTYECKMTADI